MRALERIAVVGGGAWGTALAAIAAADGREVLLWAREPEVVAAINTAQSNPLYLPECPLPASLRATGALADLREAEAVLLAVPTQFLRPIAAALDGVLDLSSGVVVCAKGVERSSLLFAGEIVAQTMPERPLAILSGPTFALEVARFQPTAITLATAAPQFGQALIARLGRPTFRPYLSEDPIGAEIGGAVKNVLAIACGIVQGRGLGDNARAALITRGLAEMLRLGLAKGARMETLMGLSGLGDLVLTCTGDKSRNMTLGREIGRGRSLAAVEGERRSVAEGVATAPAVVALAERLGVEMPICQAVDAILHRGASVEDSIRGLLARPFKSEIVP